MWRMRDTAAGVSEDQPIWHYREFADFVAILQNQGLWFSRLDRVRDPFEGLSGRHGRFHRRADDHTRKGCVSCWTVDDEESELMWYAYAPRFGVAIRSTKGKLMTSLKPPEAGNIVIGAVQYGIDWSTPPESYAFVKQRGFKREQELRAFIPYEPEYRSGNLIDCACAGKLVSVELRSLIAEVWLAPSSPQWFERVVTLEMEKYGYGAIPVRSSRAMRAEFEGPKENGVLK